MERAVCGVEDDVRVLNAGGSAEGKSDFVTRVVAGNCAGQANEGFPLEREIDLLRFTGKESDGGGRGKVIGAGVEDGGIARGDGRLGR
jgi:hypothetical protein